MPTLARSCIRKMRGGAQAHLILAADHHHYVVKFKQNPQHRRILVNEWIAKTLLDHLNVPSPAVELIEFTPSFLLQNPDIAITIGHRSSPPEPGFHFGSRMPVDPNRFVIYDYLPDALLRSIANLSDFLGVFVFDKWTNNADSRQCVFFRANVKESISPHLAHKKTAFVASMMDHGYIFGGPHWTLDDSPLSGLYSRPLVYESVSGLHSFEPWLQLATQTQPDLLDSVFRQVPSWWLNGDRLLLEELLNKLYRRRARLPFLIDDARNGRVNPFPNWR